MCSARNGASICFFDLDPFTTPTLTYCARNHMAKHKGKLSPNYGSFL